MKNGKQKTKSRRSRICPHIEKYYIKRNVLDETSDYLKKYGKRKSEALVFWAGWLDEKCEAHVTVCKIPNDINWGGGVRVELDGMLQLMDELIIDDLILLAQVHSHPGDHGHSYGDDLTASSYKKGYISIVVPNFGLIDLQDLSRCYVHEYEQNWKWKLLDETEMKDRFKIE